MKRTLALLFLLVGAITITFGQVRTLSGTVSSGEDGQTLPGVTVRIKGFSGGTTTGSNGMYSISFNRDEGVLVFSFIGLKTVEVLITSSNTYNVTMEPDVLGLDEVVVTALGISRERKALGYAVQDISGEEIQRTAETNIVNALAGKSAGVYVNSANGNVGSSSRITIRGNGSLSGENQPLFVVDGMPIDNSISSSKRGSGGVNPNWEPDFVDMGNRAMDINPKD